MNSLNSLAILFVQILMHGREEWVLVQLGSQHKRVERFVHPVFPDYPSVSCDYGDTSSSMKTVFAYVIKWRNGGRLNPDEFLQKFQD